MKIQISKKKTKGLYLPEYSTNFIGDIFPHLDIYLKNNSGKPYYLRILENKKKGKKNANTK